MNAPAENAATEAATTLMFFVGGHPQTAGSKKAMPIIRGGVRVGTRVIEDGSKANREAKRTWRQDIQYAAREAMAAQGWERSHEAVVLDFVFYRSRPASHYGTGRNARVLKPSAATWPTGRPDALKTARSAEDALTGVAYSDDAQVVVGSQTKAWTCRYAGREGCEVTIRHATAADLPGATTEPTDGGVTVELTEDEARQTYLYLRASIIGMDPGLKAAWEHTPVGMTWAKLRDVVGDEPDA